MTGLFSFQTNSKNLDLSYKTDLDIWDSLGRVNSYYSKIAKKTDLVICTHSREGKTPSFSRINMVFARICKVQIGLSILGLQSSKWL